MLALLQSSCTSLVLQEFLNIIASVSENIFISSFSILSCNSSDPEDLSLFKAVLSYQFLIQYTVFWPVFLFCTPPPKVASDMLGHSFFTKDPWEREIVQPCFLFSITILPAVCYNKYGIESMTVDSITLEKWVENTRMKFSRDKYKVFHIGNHEINRYCI